MKGKVLSFGELLLRLCPDEQGNWLYKNSMPVFAGGAEANVAAALALWDIPSAYLTAIPDNFVARGLAGFLDELHIDTSRIQYSGERLGLYYLHQGKDLKHSGVVYDRSHSSFANLKPGMLDWDAVFEDISWFHFSAICPAVNASVAAVCEEALKAASAKHISISIDLNYRARLWQYGKEPAEVLPSLVTYCDLVMGNIWAAEKMLGIPLDEEAVKKGNKECLLEQSAASSEKIMAEFPKCHTVANTFRFDQGAGICYYTTLYEKGTFQVSKTYAAETITGKVGSGDCFMAGLIYGFYHQLPAPETLDFATAAAFAKLFTLTDFNTHTISEIKKIAKAYEQ